MNKLPAGLLDENAEIFRNDDFNAFCQTNGKVLHFYEFPINLHRHLENEYDADQVAKAVVSSWYPERMQQLERFTACRYGAFSMSLPDFDAKSQVLTPDFQYCPARKACKGYGHVCLLPLCPDTNERLTKQELECMMLIASGLPDKALCDSMNIAPDTFNEYKRRAFAKLNAHSKVEAVRKAQELMQF